jgi:hypothetical protein
MLLNLLTVAHGGNVRSVDRERGFEDVVCRLKSGV